MSFTQFEQQAAKRSFLFGLKGCSCNGVFPPNGAQQVASNDTQPHEEHGATLRYRLEIIETERQRERDQMQATIDDLRARLDRSEDRITALLASPSKRMRWWPW
jgi:hypothetical protein